MWILPRERGCSGGPDRGHDFGRMTVKKSKQISLRMNGGGVASAAAISDGFRAQNGDQSFPSLFSNRLIWVARNGQGGVFACKALAVGSSEQM